MNIKYEIEQLCKNKSKYNETGKWPHCNKNPTWHDNFLVQFIFWLEYSNTGNVSEYTVVKTHKSGEL